MNGSLSGHPGKVPTAHHEQNVSLKSQFGDLPGGPVASLHSQCLGSIPGQGTRSHMLQLKPGAAKQINTYFFKKIKPQKFLKNVSALT